ncbi:histone-lysine N-methyltransferase SETMAR [Trichonephila clavata]|uniref:Histone-lysine N-methyltransferase SETMAR n=1 Tax=Trichonephila clavata TaxID=2740835 RepID=A0A8X6M092_TRICU|nr:histone-lysine N-methyltransferase SETMAR [Trichonephila clavata]
MSTIDEQRSGRPLSVRPDLARAVSEQFMDEDRRCSLLELERASGIERYPHRPQRGIVHRILRNELHLRKIALRWVPHALTEVKRCLRYAIWSDHFARLQQDSDQLLSRIFAINEFWAWAYQPEPKRQSAE